MEVPDLKLGEFFSFLCMFYFLVTVLLEYLDHTFFTCLVLLYISLPNILSAFKSQKVCTSIVTSHTDRFSSYSIKWITL